MCLTRLLFFHYLAQSGSVPEVMAESADRLARKCLGQLPVVVAIGASGTFLTPYKDLLSNTDSSKRVVIGIVGVPGSGKTTLAAAVSSRINEIHGTSNAGDAPVAVALPMDGFHYSRAHLVAMPNPEEAIHRRGAAFTFDAEGFCSLISSLVSDGDSTVCAPSFDHAVKDPVEDAIPVSRDSRIVLVEGNYCALDREPWKTAAGMLSEIWYVDTPKEVTWERLSKRHLVSGICASEQEAWDRATGTDELNAKDIRENMVKVDEVITAA